jgi:hypothetical protein
MAKNLTQKAIQIRDELVALEQQFNTKKEEFLVEFRMDHHKHNSLYQ